MKNDFFSFCTSLKPIELKGLGELSKVEHMDEGVTVYSVGSASEAMYIINRGAVEVIHEDPRYADRTVISYLSRGDMFGEIGVLTDQPRKNAIRTCEPVSLQVFRKKDFPEIVKRVPGFFYYICQQLALRLVQVSDMAFVQSNCLELSGSLSNFDLVTIYQTILNSSQTGELSIFNEANEPIAVFFFENGIPKYGQYFHLHGEEAFWQLFLHEKLPGTFSFAIRDLPPEQVQTQAIERNPTDMLITALQYRDEFKQMSLQLPPPEAVLRRQKLNLDWSDPEYRDLQHVAEEVWQICYSSPMTFEELFQRVNFCELRLCKTLGKLLSDGHFKAEGQSAPMEVAS